MDKERFDFAKQLYRHAGLSEADAMDYAELHMAFVIGSRMTLAAGDREEVQRKRRIAVELLVPRDRVGR